MDEIKGVLRNVVGDRKGWWRSAVFDRVGSADDTFRDYSVYITRARRPT